MSPPAQEFRFDGFVLRRDSGELVREGAVVRLQEQPLTVLVELLSRPRQVVTREQLIARLWPIGVVDYETGLNTVVRKLRAALGDDADAPRYIETLPRRGYRFIGTLEAPLDPPPPTAHPAAGPVAEAVIAAPQAGSDHVPAPDGKTAPSAAAPHQPIGRRPWLWLGAAALLLASVVLGSRLVPRPEPPAVRALAVLPFQPLLAESANPALELGMTDTLITQLSVIPGLRVSSLAAVRPYGGATQDPIEAGRALEVDVVLEGSLQADRERLRVSARLLRVSDGEALWAGDFSEPLSGIFELQDAVAHRVVTALAVRLSSDQERRLSRLATTNAAAYQHYASGLYLWQQRRPEAVEQFEAALQADPGYAPAWAGLANALAALAVYGYAPPAAAFTRAREAARRAVELDPGSAAARAALGQVLVQGERRYREGEQEYLAALRLDPNDATARFRLGIARASMGRLAEAAADMERARALEPLTLNHAVNLAMVKYLQRDYAGAQAELDRVLALDPDLDHARAVLGRVLLAQGKTDAAIEQFRRVKRGVPGGDGDLGAAYAGAGRVAEARAELERLARRAAEGYGGGYDQARILASLGENPQACEALDRAFADRSPLLGFLRNDPAMDSLRSDPCYQAALRRLEAAGG